MKIVLISFFTFLSGLTVFSQSEKLIPTVNENVELLSIVFRLAGAEEYSKCNVQNYASDIDKYFVAYKDDELIRLINEIRKKNEVAYDAIMSMALYITFVNGNFIINENAKKENLDSRWGTYTEQFLTFLTVFYNKTNFHKFYLDHEQLYSIAKNRYSEKLNKIDLPWFENFFGYKRNGNFNYILSIANGGGNYGPSVKFLDGTEEIYSIICIWETDSSGYPIFTEDYTSVIVHEFMHSFSNPLIDKYYSEMESAARVMYKLVENEMEQQAYGDLKTMLYESLVRASCIIYLKDHLAHEKALNKLIRFEQLHGFICINPIINSLNRYQNSRTTYGNLDSYMPVIVSLFNALDFSDLQKESRCIGPAQIIDFSIKNNSIDVDPNTSELVIKFDMPMSGSFGLSHGKGGQKQYPKINSFNWNMETMTEVKIKLTLDPGKKYSLSFPSVFILDENYCELNETYYLDFKTKK